MNFVQWATAAVLLLVALGGLYAGVVALARRRVEVPPYVFGGVRAILLALIYLGSAAAALLALVLLFTSAG
jgi:hypothetical protein